MKTQRNRRKVILIAAMISILLAIIFLLQFLFLPKADKASKEIALKDIFSRDIFFVLSKGPNSLTEDDYIKVEHLELHIKPEEFDDFLRPLDKLTNLQTLGVYGPGIGGQVLYRPSKIPVWVPSRIRSRIRQWFEKPRYVDIAALKKLKNLRNLSLVRLYVRNIKPLANLKGLQELSLQETQVKDIRPLAGLVNLQTLNLSFTKTDNIKPLANLTKLQELDIAGTLVSDIRPLANLTRLRIIRLRGTQISQQQISELQKALPNVEIQR